MRDVCHKALSLLRRFGAGESGSFATIFAMTVPVMVGMAGAAVDYSNLSLTRGKLQAAADAAALAAAREFRLGNTSTSLVTEAASKFATATLAGHGMTASVEPSADQQNRTVTVSITATTDSYVLALINPQATFVRATATARMVGGAPICVIGLDRSANHTLELDKSAKLEAPNCAIYSNSSKPQGLIARKDSSMIAAFICSAGGRSANNLASFKPTPQTDCPPLPDPLASRPLPNPGVCRETGLEIKSGSVSLAPGTYCDGLTIRGGARVVFEPGVFVFKNGGLRVTDNASVSGVNVGLHFVGSGAALRFDPNTSISLTAPRTGDMAGILISEDRNNPQGQSHEIMSDDARTLLGTIYLPQGRLFIGANRPVADRSAYTIVVSRTFNLSEGPTMVLNTDYGATDIPVPQGVGQKGTSTALTR